MERISRISRKFHIPGICRYSQSVRNLYSVAKNILYIDSSYVCRNYKLTYQLYNSRL